MLRNDLRAILMHQQNADAGWMRPVDFLLAFNNALVALGKDFGNQGKAIGVTRVRIFVLPYHGDIGLRIKGHGGYDVHADVMIGDKGWIAAPQRRIQQGFEVARDPLMAAVPRIHHHRNAFDQLPMLLFRP